MAIRPGDHLLPALKVDGSSIKWDRSRLIAQHIVEQQRERIKTTLQFDPVWMLHYRRKSSGRRCSCWTVEDSPSGHCGVCWGTGTVGGYDKVGYQTEIVDTTLPGLVLYNVVPVPESQRRPIPFGLLPNFSFGRVECSVSMRGSLGLDLYQFVALQSQSSQVFAYVKRSSEAEYVSLTRTTLQEKLLSGGSKLDFRFDLHRTASGESPLFSHFVVRHQTKERVLVPMDLPKESRSTALLEMGITDSVQTVRGWTSYEYDPISNEDMLVNVGRLPEHVIHGLAASYRSLNDLAEAALVNGLRKSERNSARFKVIGVEKTAPLGVLQSLDMDLRYIGRYETLNQFPV